MENEHVTEPGPREGSMRGGELSTSFRTQELLFPVIVGRRRNRALR
jgi:hypothetical protein